MHRIARVLFLSLMIPLTAMSFAQPAPPADRQHQMLKSAGLTDDQAARVADVFTSAQEAMRTQRAQLQVLDAQIRLAMTAPSPDMKAVGALVDQKAKVRAELEKQSLATEAEIHKIAGDPAFGKLKKMWMNRLRRGPEEGGQIRQRQAQPEGKDNQPPRPDDRGDGPAAPAMNQ